MSEKAYPLLDYNDKMLGYILIDLSRVRDHMTVLQEKMTIELSEKQEVAEISEMIYARIFAQEFYTGMEMIDRKVCLKLVKPIRDGVYNPHKLYGFFPLVEKFT